MRYKVRLTFHVWHEACLAQKFSLAKKNPNNFPLSFLNLTSEPLSSHTQLLQSQHSQPDLRCTESPNPTTTIPAPFLAPHLLSHLSRMEVKALFNNPNRAGP